MKYLQQMINARQADSKFPELKETFNEEVKYLSGIIKKKLKDKKSGINVLDACCGEGYTLRDLGEKHKEANFFGMDNDSDLVSRAQIITSPLKNITIVLQDILSMPSFLAHNFFDLSYSTFNTLGSFRQEERFSVLSEMYRAIKEKGYLATITWKNKDKNVTDFLKQYYTYIGFKIKEIDDNKTIVENEDDGKLNQEIFERLSLDELSSYYLQLGIKDIKIDPIGKLWIAFSGKK